MKITEQEFVDTIELMKKQSDWDAEFMTHMEKAFPGSYSPIYKSTFIWKAAIRLLEIATGDKSGCIERWVYENDFGRSGEAFVSWDNKGEKNELNLKDAQTLYQYLSSEE